MPKINFPQSHLDVAGIVYFFIGIVYTIKDGFLPNTYDRHYDKFPNQPQDYPLGLVLFIISMMVVHMGILLLLSRYAEKRPLLAYMGGIIVTLFFVFIMVSGSIHAPPAWTIFIFWEIGLLIVMIATAGIGIFKNC